jgi:hypothetical protein
LTDTFTNQPKSLAIPSDIWHYIAELLGFSMKRLFIFLTILTTIIPPKITASTIEGEYFQIESAHCHWDECEFLRIDGKNIVLGLNEERLVFEKVDQVIRFAGSIWYQSSVINEDRKLAINGYLSSDGVLSVHFVGKEDIEETLETKWTHGWARFRKNH